MKTKFNFRSRNHLSFQLPRCRRLSFLLSFFAMAFVTPAKAQNVTIVESQSNGHVMDTVWRYYATQLGMNATIVSQSTIYDSSFFSSTDILIISSGVITLTNDQITAIEQFMESGK